MTENTDPSSDSSSDLGQISVAALVLPELTAGGLLRRARETAGLHIAALAVSLKVPVKKLEALEADRLDLLTDAVFARALAASVCRALKVDSAPLLQLLPQTSRPRWSQQTDSRSSLVGTALPRRPSNQSRSISKQAVVGGMLLVLGALALAVWPTFDFLSPAPDTMESDATALSPLPVMAVEPMPPVPLPVAVAALAAEATSAPVNVSVVGAGDLRPAVELAQANTLPGHGSVVFKPTAGSWVEVVDVKGTVLLRRKLVAGEVVAASGALPLQVVVGRADVTPVQIRGRSFDMTPVTRDNVARFEVN